MTGRLGRNFSTKILKNSLSGLQIDLFRDFILYSLREGEFPPQKHSVKFLNSLKHKNS